MLAEEPAPAAEGLLALTKGKRILVSVGAGGVGKTTLAAAIGLLGARCERSTLVMTIDPARRLAAALGLEELDHSARQVPASMLEQEGLPGGLLRAMMLDQKRAFDEVIARHARDEESYQRVLRNKLYKELSTRLAGGQEYAAMEMLHEIVERNSYDLVVLDTPPTLNAFDFLDAPKKMVELLDGPAVRLFIRGYEATGRLSFKLLSAGATFVFKRIARFVGGAFLDDVAEFFGDLHSMLEGFRRRAADVVELLRREDVAFVIVASPDERAISQAVSFYERLVASGMHLGAFVINRVHLAQPSAELDVEELRERLAKHGLDAAEAELLAPVLLRSREQFETLAAADAAVIQRLVKRCGDQHLYIRVPLFSEDVHDVPGLARLSAWLS